MIDYIRLHVLHLLSHWLLVGSNSSIAPNLQFCITKLGSRINSKDEASQRLNDIIKTYKYIKKLLSIT